MSYLTLPDTEFRYKSLNNFMDNNKYVGPNMIELSLRLKTTEWHFDSVCVACVYMVCFFVICFHIIYRAVATATPAVLLAGSELLGSRWRHIWCWWARQRQQIHVHPGAVEAARRLHDRPTPAAFAAAGAMAERRCTRDDANDQAKSVETGGNQVHHIIMAHRAETQWGPSKTQWTLVSQGPARSQWDSDRLGTNCVKGYVTDLEQIVIWCIFFNQYLIET